MQCLKLPPWKGGHCGFEPHSGLQVLKKQDVSSPLTRKDSILWGASVTERWRTRPQTARARISNSVSGGGAVSSRSSHHPQEVLLAQFSPYMHKGGLNPHSFHFCLAPRTSSG